MTRENQQTEVTALKKYPAGISGFEENTGGGKTLFATVCIFLVLFYTAKAYSELSIAGEGYDLTNHSLLFLGNETLPPMVYLENDKPVGIVVDLAEALKERMTRPVRFKYMHWTQAQQLVLEGKADALLQINPTEERKKKYDFSDSLLESEFSIFISFDREGVYDITDLRGLKVGVEGKGLPINILKQDPLIKSVVVADVLRGFRLLANGAIDAVIVDRWVGSFVLAENNIRGIRIAGEAIDKSNSAIAVVKGNTELLSEINKALAEIKEDGTYTEILAKWQSEEVIFRTKDQYFKQKIILAATLFVLIIAIIWGIFLLNEIKKRKKTEEALRESEEQYRILIEAASMSGQAITMQQDRDGIEAVCVFANDVTVSLTGYTRDELSKMSWLEMVHPLYRDAAADRYRRRMQGEEISELVPIQLIRKDGTEIPIELTSILTTFMGTKTLVTLSRDITERVKAEEHLKTSLKEKEVLLREIHHRVKNNMQVIISLLKLQSGNVKDKQVLNTLMNSQMRIEAMASVHETLYSTESLAAIDFKTYASKLAGTIFQTYGTSSSRVELKIEAEDIVFEIEKATPVGLIINELVSNALKHAFPDNRSGEITIRLNKIKEDEIELVVGDNGIGLPEAFDFRNSDTLGFKLVKIIAETQLDGNIELDRKGGSHFNIRFKLEDSI